MTLSCSDTARSNEVAIRKKERKKSEKGERDDRTKGRTERDTREKGRKWKETGLGCPNRK